MIIKGILLWCLCCLILNISGKPVTMNVLLGYQDSLGQYSFGYSTFNSARSEIKTANGVIRGAYSYVDENGVIQSTEYVADDDGFRVIATNPPQSPVTIENIAGDVSTARKAHLEAFLTAEKMAEDIGNERERPTKAVSEPKITVESSSLIDKSRSIERDHRSPVPAFGSITYGDQVLLLPTGEKN